MFSNLEEEKSELYMKKHHENHKKKSLKKVVMFDHENHLDDLIH